MKLQGIYQLLLIDCSITRWRGFFTHTHLPNVSKVPAKSFSKLYQSILSLHWQLKTLLYHGFLNFRTAASFLAELLAYSYFGIRIRSVFGAKFGHWVAQVMMKHSFILWNFAMHKKKTSRDKKVWLHKVSEHSFMNN